MSKYRRFIIGIIITEVLLLLFVGRVIITDVQRSSGTLYKVDVQRICNRLEAGETIDDINLNAYETIKDIRVFDVNERSQYSYVVEEANNQLYRFEYEDLNENNLVVLLVITGILIVFFSAALLIYLERKIITPFYRMNHMTTELAKGNLSVPISQEKSKYFKQFIWGLDMLREKLEADKKRELELVKEKKTLLLSLSHDIKTPLSAIDLYAKALKLNLYEDEKKKTAAIEGIENNIVEIKRYVGEIVKASREEFLALKVENTEVYISTVLEEIIKYYAEKCKGLHIDFVVELVSDCLVYGDRERMIEVLQNVIENAIKYGDGNKIIVDTTEEENCKLVRVKNTGCTLGSDEVIHLFDSFYRGSNANKIEGSGLGLFICKELMHKMDGEIYANIADEEFCVVTVFRKI